MPSSEVKRRPISPDILKPLSFYPKVVDVMLINKACKECHSSAGGLEGAVFVKFDFQMQR